MTFIIPEPFGPFYPDLGATVAEFRRKANLVGSIKEMLPNDRRAYADAIEKAIRAKHRTLHMRPTPSENNPEPLGIKRLAMLNTQLLACPAKERAARTPEQWQAMYDAAMKVKRA